MRCCTAWPAASTNWTRTPKPRELCTIGVYGFDAESFGAALTENGVDLLVDIRRRRGVRGPQYAWANAKKLTGLLYDLLVFYEHVLELAPPTELLRFQHEIDRHGAGMRSRTALDPLYVERYEREVLAAADLDATAAVLSRYERPALLCVETDAATCHRSLAAAALAPRLEVSVRHLSG
jgi:uncharacterized protein (DUF488 family)